MANLLKFIRFPRPDQPAPVYKGPLNLWEPFRYTAIGDAQRNVSPRSELRPRLDVRLCEWAPQFGWVARVVDGTVAKWVGALATDAENYRVPGRPLLDVVRPEWSPSPSSWIFNNLPVTLTTAQQWPAVLLGLQPSYRSADGPRLDVRTQEARPEPGWRQAIIDAEVRRWTPAFEGLHGTERSRDHAALDVRLGTWDPGGWITANIPSSLTVAQWWPAVLAGSPPNFRTAERARLDVRGQEWSPETGWGQPVVDANIRTWMPAIDALLAAERSRPRAGLDVRLPGWDAAGWLTVNVPVTVTTAQQWPALLLALAPGYRSGDRARLDVRGQEWSPQFGWAQTAVDPIVKSWAPIWNTELNSYRPPARARLELRGPEWAPAFSWVQRPVDAIVRTWAPIFTTQRTGVRTPGRPLLDVLRPDWCPELGWLEEAQRGAAATLRVPPVGRSRVDRLTRRVATAIAATQVGPQPLLAPFGTVVRGLTARTATQTTLRLVAAVGTRAASAYEAAVLADAPVVYYRLNTVAPASRVLDAAGHGHDTFVEAASLVTQDVPGLSLDRAMEFGPGNAAAGVLFGASDIPAWLPGAITGVRSLELWVRGDPANTHAVALLRAVDGAAHGWSVLLFGAKVVFVSTEFDSVETVGVPTIRDGAWHHVVITLDGINLLVYLDGLLDGVATNAQTPFAGANLTIAADVDPTLAAALGLTDAATAPWHVWLDEIALYDQTLTAAQVATHFAAATGGPPPARLVTKV